MEHHGHGHARLSGGAHGFPHAHPAIKPEKKPPGRLLRLAIAGETIAGYLFLVVVVYALIRLGMLIGGFGYDEILGHSDFLARFSTPSGADPLSAIPTSVPLILAPVLTTVHHVYTSLGGHSS